jgi:hypothetical protein
MTRPLTSTERRLLKSINDKVSDKEAEDYIETRRKFLKAIKEDGPARPGTKRPKGVSWRRALVKRATKKSGLE